MSNNTPYIYCQKNNEPVGPVADNLDTDSGCGTVSAVKATYKDIKFWMVSCDRAKVTLSGYVYNATQRGTYYHDWNCTDAAIFAPSVLGPCPDDNTPRTFTGKCIVKGKYSYTPCHPCDEGCNSSCDPFVGLNQGFYVPREAHDLLDFNFTVNKWAIAAVDGEKGFYWEVPIAKISSGSCDNPEDGKNNSSAYRESSNSYYNSLYTNNQNLPGAISGLDLDDCFDIPVSIGTRYGCNSGGFDCFGINYYTGEVVDGGLGFWVYQGGIPNGDSGPSFIFTTTWYWRNKHSKFPCGECSYGHPTKDCDTCEHCTPYDSCCGKGCTCASCGGSPSPCGSSGSCGGSIPWNSGGTNKGGCGGGLCGDHDVWQSGNITIQVTLLGYDKQRCQE